MSYSEMSVYVYIPTVYLLLNDKDVNVHIITFKKRNALYNIAECFCKWVGFVLL